MPLQPGDKLGPYEILAPLGAGGMGEVYRAKDTKLKRDVAIKVLPAALAHDPERLARFEREARLLASLDHPNIGAIYGLEESTSTRALILALIEGPTLADRIAVGPIPLEETIHIAQQMAEAIEYAHDRGVIHRDLKPANVKITPEGTVKVLDFGLAKALTGESESSSGSPANSPTMSPTLTMRATQAGMILGTAAYMAPEQAKGKTVDRRADIWAFGVVLFEMLTGERLFTGDTAAEIIASAIKEEPRLDRLPSSTPSGIRRLIERCLIKDPKQRLQAIGEARIILSSPMEEDTDRPAQLASAPRYRSWLPWCIAAFLLLALMPANIIHFRESPPLEQMMRATIPLLENSTVHSFAISPDGHYLAIAVAVNGKQQLWLRAMDALQAQPMPFTEDATFPFWSPDNRYIGFFAQGKLKKIAASGGPAQSLCDAPDGRGGSWSRDDVIVFSPSNAGISIQRVAATGGVPTDVTKVTGPERYPVFLPDARHFLYQQIGLGEQSGIYVSSLDGKENHRVLADVSGVVFAPLRKSASAGHILFVRENTLMALPFDAANEQVTGEAFPVADGMSDTTSRSYLQPRSERSWQWHGSWQCCCISCG